MCSGLLVTALLLPFLRCWTLLLLLLLLLLSFARRYKHTAASFLLAQMYYEGRGDRNLPNHYVEPNLGVAYGYFKRLSSQHSSRSLEAAFDAYNAGNTSLALLLYLLHAEVSMRMHLSVSGCVCLARCPVVLARRGACMHVCGSLASVAERIGANPASALTRYPHTLRWGLQKGE